jgi:hypothetical protein
VFRELNTSYHSEIFEIIFQTSIKPILRGWVQEIMTSPDMDEGERKGKIIAYNEILTGFLRMYENSKIDTPEWLIREFNL